jgi:hypothetical protein
MTDRQRQTVQPVQMVECAHCARQWPATAVRWFRKASRPDSGLHDAQTTSDDPEALPFCDECREDLGMGAS